MTAPAPPPGLPRRRPRARWTAAVLAALLAVGAAAHAARLVRSTWRDTHPPRVLPAGRPEGEEGGGYRDVALESDDGVRLSGWWRPAENGAAVVFVHGQYANREQLHAQAGPLARAGFGVLLFDLRAHGLSGGGVSTWGDRERLDVAAAVRFARAQPGVRAVGAVGFSIGALAVADAAEDDPEIAAVVLEAMQGSAADDVRSTYGAHGPLSALPALWATQAQGIDLAAVRPAEHLARLGPRPVLLVYGEHDRVAPPAVGEALLSRLPGPGELWVVPGAGHGGWERDPAASAALGRHLATFLSAALLPRVRAPAGGAPAARAPSAAPDPTDR